MVPEAQHIAARPNRARHTEFRGLLKAVAADALWHGVGHQRCRVAEQLDDRRAFPRLYSSKTSWISAPDLVEVGSVGQLIDENITQG